MNSYIAGKSEFVKKVLELAEAEKYSLWQLVLKATQWGHQLV
jgi:hypothetical protein